MTLIQNLLRSLILVIKLHFPTYKTEVDTFGVSLARELNRRHEKKKVQQKRPPPPIRKRRKEVSKRGYSGSRSKDVRYSSQRALRRMYRNS